jgi:Na+-transporting NADH:ubiquinone oxidoreductase subunit NqrD
MQGLDVSWAVTQVSQMIVDVFVGIVVCNVMVTGPYQRIEHGSHATGKLFVSGLTHGLQHGHLLIFNPTINLKVI